MRKALVGIATTILLIAAAAACLTLLRIRTALKDARQTVGAEGNLAFQIRTLRRDSNSGVEALPSPNDASIGAAFAGKLYLASPGGLRIYDQPSSEPRLLTTGLDLPAAGIVTLAQGRLRGQSSAQLIAATHGEGILFLSSNANEPVTQLRADDAAIRDVTAVLPLASGDLLIGTRNAGVLVYDGKKLHLFQPSFAGLNVTALAGDEEGFWVGTRNRGVLHWHAGQTDTFDVASGLPDNQIEDIAIANDRVFVGTPLGVAAFRKGRFDQVLAQGLFAHRLAVEGNSLLVATLDEGIHEVDLQPRRSPRGPPLEQSLNGASFFAAQGRLLALSDGRLLRHENGAWPVVISPPPQTLSDRNISALHFSQDGRLWIGYFDHGVDVLDLASQQAQHVEDDHVFCVNRIVSDPLRQTVDVATANGLVLFDATRSQPVEKQVLQRKDGLISDQVSDVAFTRDGMALATPAGLTFFTPQGAQSLYAFQGLVNNHVYTLAAESSNERLMAGTLGGVSVLEDGNVRRNITLKNSGLKRNWTTAMLKVPQSDGQDAWFIGTYGGGVVEMDNTGRVSEMTGANRTAVINPNALLLTSRWVLAGSLSDGLLVYNRATSHWSAITEGLPSKNVTALAENSGELYVGTDNGLVRVAEAKLP